MDVFAELNEALGGDGSRERALVAVDLLIEHLAQEHRWAEWFRARLMRTRLELGSLPDDVQIATAREAGTRYLNDGNIPRAWPYFHAIGDHQPVVEAIEKLDPSQFTEEILTLSFQERLNPRKALELSLRSSGICRAITVFDQYPDPSTWEEGLSLITHALSEELEQSLKLAIARHDSSTPDTDSIRELIASREWLFGQYDSYVYASHLFGILRLALDSQNPETLRLALEMAEYGCCLSATFTTSTPPPFDDYCRDHAIYLRALLGEEVDRGIAHFRKKTEDSDPARAGTFPAEVLVRLLVRLDRPNEAVKVFEQFLLDRDPGFLTCPDLPELCQRAGDFERLQKLSRERNDPVGFLEAALAQRTAH